jgi:crossover junction endodeoxyribonuclease RuvC
MRVLGVDPGTLVTGFGVVDVVSGGVRHVAHGTVRTRPKDPLWIRITKIHDALSRVIEVHRPDALALETCFVGKNIQSALKLGHTRGAVMVAAAAADLEIAEYAPTLIKQAVTGRGRADKVQVAEMVKMILGLKEAAPSDASDALAAAITHVHGNRSGLVPFTGARP